VTIFESADRIGGRTLSQPLQTHPETTVDLGGQWIGANQDAALQLIRELGLTLHPQYHTGKRVLQFSGEAVKTYTGLIPNASWSVLIDAQLTLFLVAVLRFLLWLLPGSCLAKWADSSTVAQLTSRVMWTHGGRALVRIVVQGLFGCEPEDLSLNAFCRYVNASGGVDPMVEIGPGTLQCWTVVGGTQQLSQGLLARAGPRVKTCLCHRVLAIKLQAPPLAQQQQPPGSASLAATGAGAPITLVCDNGAEFFADFVVLALPPSLAQNITFSPPLEPARSALMAGAKMGGIIKSVAVYSTAFWREEGYSGEAIGETRPGAAPVFNTFDNWLPARNTKHAGAGAPTREGLSITSGASVGGAPALVLFINGARATEWSARSPEARREAVLQQLAGWYGPRALYPVEYVEKDWVADDHTRGCPIASYPAALLTAYGLQRPLAEPAWVEQWQCSPGGPSTSTSTSTSPSNSASSSASALTSGASSNPAAAVAVARLYFAGTEVAQKSTGFIDGAIRAGQAAAEAVAGAVASLRQASHFVQPHPLPLTQDRTPVQVEKVLRNSTQRDRLI